MHNSEQIKHPSSNHIYTKSTPKHIHCHYIPSVIPITHTTHVILQLHPYTHHILIPGFVDKSHRSNCPVGQMDGDAGGWTTSGKIGLPTLSRVMGVGRQPQHHDHLRSVLSFIRVSGLGVRPDKCVFGTSCMDFYGITPDGILPLADKLSAIQDYTTTTMFVLLTYWLHFMTLGGKFAGFTQCMKLFLDFKRLSAGIFPYREWASFVSCLAFSTLAHTSRLILCGAIPLHDLVCDIPCSACTIELCIQLVCMFWSRHTVAGILSHLVPMLLLWLYLCWLPI